MDNTIKPKILLIDDSQETLDLLTALIEPLHAETIAAIDFETAQEILRNNQIDLVLLDLVFPKISGIEIAKEIRQVVQAGELPIIFMSGSQPTKERLIECYSVGAIDYIVKPFIPEVVTSKVEQYLAVLTARIALQESHEKIVQQRAYYESILSAAGDGVLKINQDHVIAYANTAAEQILCYEAGEILNLPVSLVTNHHALFKAEAYQEVLSIEQEAIFKRKDGLEFFVSYTCRNNASFPGYVIVFKDITERKQQERILKDMAERDALTGLLNRRAFTQALQQSFISTVSDEKSSIGLLFIDLNRFKQVNDTLGHEAGDRLLITVSKRLQMCVSSPHTLARLGGDEFAILVRNIKDQSELKKLATAIVDELSYPVVLLGKQHQIETSIGAALYSEDICTPEKLMRSADLAMYHSKFQKNTTFTLFSDDIKKSASIRDALFCGLDDAIRQNQFRLYYQPICTTSIDKIEAFEALIRWEHPEFGLLAPKDFISLAEKHHLIERIDKWVLDRAVKEFSEKKANFEFPPTLSLNFSIPQLEASDLISHLDAILKQYRWPAKQLQIEIPEQVLANMSNAILDNLYMLSERGVKLILNDFAAGQTMLKSIAQLPICGVKIDRTILTAAEKEPTMARFIAGLFDFIRSLEIDTIGMGVESQLQQALLASHQCSHIQGNGLAEPATIEDLPKLLPSLVSRKLPNVANK